MFRYLAIHWSPGCEASAAEAADHRRRLTADPAWIAALRAPNLELFVRGTSKANSVLYLQGSRGAVLGQVFDRYAFDSQPEGLAAIDDRRTEAIVQSSGKVLVRDHWGRYVAFFQDIHGHWLLLRDSSGALPCLRYDRPGLSIAFSWLEDLLHLQIQRPAADLKALVGQLKFGDFAHHRTALRDIYQLMPGEVWEIGTPLDSGRVVWRALDHARSVPLENRHEAIEALRTMVRACTRAWVSRYDSVLLRLSGGLDSAILLSCLTPGATSAQVHCVNYHSEGADSDERAFARLAARVAGYGLIEEPRVDHFNLASILHAAAMPAPVSHVGRLGSDSADARLAAELAATALFTGGGGDQLFFEFDQPWPAADYLQRYGYTRAFLPVLVDSARLGRISVWRALRTAAAQARMTTAVTPLPSIPLGLWREEVLSQITDPSGIQHPALCTPTGLPIGKRMQLQQVLHPMQYYDPFQRDRSPELVNPLLSQPLVELCLRIPSYMLTTGGWGRGLARSAFASSVPSAIIHRRGKGGMSDHIRRVLLDNLPFVRETLLHGALRAAGLLDVPRAEKLLASSPPTIAGRADELHVTLAAESWLRKWV